MADTLLVHCDGFNLVKVVQRLELDVLSQNITLEKVGHIRFALVGNVPGRWDSEYVVEFLEGEVTIRTQLRIKQ